MRRDDVRPFAVPPSGAISATDWVRIRGDLADPVEEYIPDWDQNTELHFRCVISVDVEKVCEATNLPGGALAWAIGWYVPETGLLGSPKVIGLDANEFEIDLAVSPQFTGNSIRLTRRLVLARPLKPPTTSLRAHIPGSILWSDETPIRLAGNGAAFPTEIVNFSKVPSLARVKLNSWYLDLPASVDQPVLGGLLLMINSSDHALAAAVSATTPNENERMLVQLLQESVVDQIVQWALARWDELVDLDDDTSVGSVARVLTRRVLPDPENWVGEAVDAMELYAKIVDGARRIGLGRTLT